MAAGRAFGGPWVGRSYAHVVLPRPHVDEAGCALLDDSVLREPGWRVVDPQAPPPVLFRRWRHERGATLLVVVLGWYPGVLTVGSDQRAGGRVRRARQRIVDASLRSGGRVVADASWSDCWVGYTTAGSGRSPRTPRSNASWP